MTLIMFLIIFRCINCTCRVSRRFEESLVSSILKSWNNLLYALQAVSLRLPETISINNGNSLSLRNHLMLKTTVPFRLIENFSEKSLDVSIDAPKCKGAWRANETKFDWNLSGNTIIRCLWKSMWLSLYWMSHYIYCFAKRFLLFPSFIVNCACEAEIDKTIFRKVLNLDGAIQ